MNLCKIGLHDWELVECLYSLQLEEMVKADLEDRFQMSIMSRDYKYYARKVCIKCGKIVDTITPQIEKIKQKYYIKKNRQKQARKIVGEIK